MPRSHIHRVPYDFVSTWREMLGMDQVNGPRSQMYMASIFWGLNSLPLDCEQTLSRTEPRRPV